MRLEEHVERTKERFGGLGHADLHRWLDRFNVDFCGWHRILLHHEAGIELAVSKFGEASREIARMHVADDFNGLLPQDPAETARLYPGQPILSLARMIVDKLRELYGQDFGLTEIWGK